MDYRDRHVVVTGGTGALGTAVVAHLIEAGATCHVPYRSEDEAKHFPFRDSKHVSLVALGDLSDEAAVNTFYGGPRQAWASIDIAGGFAFAPIEKSDKALLMGQIESNLVSAYLCSPRGRQCVPADRAAAGASSMSRHVPRSSRAPARSMTAYTASKAGLAGLTQGARRRGRQGRHPGECGRALDHGHGGEPQVDAAG